ncbi:MAG: hypothetical protein ABJE47_10490 [bacterium]
MPPRVYRLILALVVLGAQLAPAQTTPAVLAPTTRAGVPAFDVEVVRRAAAMIDSPVHWNRADDDKCSTKATTFSIICALQLAAEGASGARRAGNVLAPSDCSFQRTSQGVEGSCGPLFDEFPIFTVARAPTVTTGAWRDDAKPTEVWSGKMADVAAPVMLEARRTVDAVTKKKYPGRLVGYNSDSATTFADLEKYFHVLGDRVTSNAVADFAESGDSVEIEVYAGGTGVVRTYTGWYPFTNFVATETTIHFQMDTARQVAPNDMDRRIIRRAAAILASDAVWNRADDRKCPPSATMWSIYCAVQKATTEITGGFHHRRPAAELVRVIVEERTKGKEYDHRLMGYNNDKSTALHDVESLFATALTRIK